MTEKKPLKRNKALKPFSIDHHHGLLLCWKIRTGIRKDIDITRIGNYAKWFFDNHLKPHFELEEEYMFPILGSDALIVKAIGDHRTLAGLFSEEPSLENLSTIADVLESHIRFEERILFEKIQSAATETQLTEIEKFHHNAKFIEHEDEFWK